MAENGTPFYRFALAEIGTSIAISGSDPIQTSISRPGLVAMDTSRIDRLLQFAILVAGAEDYGQRRLGPIHLIKYAYVGDLGYAEEHPTETFTGAPWRFYHFGPWAEEVRARIEPAMAAIGANRYVFAGQYDKDPVRFELTDESRRIALEKALPFEVSRAIRKAVHEYGAATPELLHYVYGTWPMRHAAPNEVLSFDVPPHPNRPGVKAPESNLEVAVESNSARRKREARIADARSRIREALIRQRSDVRMVEPPMKPRYDAVFYEGMKLIDELEGAVPHSHEGELEIEDGVWKSPFRTQTDLP